MPATAIPEWQVKKNYSTAEDVKDQLEELRDKMLSIDEYAADAITIAIEETSAAMDRMEG